MRQRIEVAIQAVALIIAGVFPCCAAAGQSAPTASLEEQLKAQYKLTRAGINGVVTHAGVVLVVQEDGLGANPASWGGYWANSVDKRGRIKWNIMQNFGNHDAHEVRDVQVGEKVYVTNIEAKGTGIVFSLQSCGACNPSAVDPNDIPYRAKLSFRFEKGYVDSANFKQIQETIGKVFAMDTAQTEAPPPPASEQPAPAEVRATPAQALTNDDIIKMVQVKLADSVVIAKIKSSDCAFDTSADALIKLKQAGVSDAVLQAMLEGGGQLMTAPSPQPTPPPPETPLLPAGPEKSVELQNAEVSAKNFVDQGSSFRQRVRHVHAFGDCSGVLTVERGYLSFQSQGAVKKAHDFRVSGAEITGLEQRDQEPGGFPTHPLFLRFRGPDGKEKKYYLTTICHSARCVQDMEQLNSIVLGLVQQYVK